MEKSLDELLKENFQMKDTEAKSYSPLVLAYIGDGIYDLVIRTVVVNRGNTQANKLHRKTSSLVKAAAQAAMVDELLELLTEEEKSVFKRGRNAKSATMAKNATMADYRKATGFEALMGYLYLSNQMERMVYLIKEGLDRAKLVL
ncbi:MAG: ribonuclease III [Lachnospiraceae bacterium]|nr:ribonuclease III [Lachnospiraceae bacterium]